MANFVRDELGRFARKGVKKASKAAMKELDRLEATVTDRIQESQQRQALLKAQASLDKARAKADAAKAQFDAESKAAGRGGSYDEEAAYQAWQRAELTAKRAAAKVKSLK